MSVLKDVKEGYLKKSVIFGTAFVLAAVLIKVSSFPGAQATMPFPDKVHRGNTSAVWSVSLSEEVFVPAGPFLMGCSEDTAGGNLCALDAQPIHAVYVDAYMIDKTEVSNAQYAVCVAAGGCLPPLANNSETRTHYYDNQAYANYPVLQMDWSRANAYCQWVNKRLPTEAEWEKAARGDDLRPYPWGFDEMTCEKANVGIYYVDDQGIPRSYYCVGDTAPVDSHPAYASPYGALNMVGNAQEWVNDIYLRLYYNTSPYYNPQGAESTATNERSLRGGCWKGILTHANNWVRLDEADIYYEELNGFRCARTVSEGTPTPTPTATPTPTPTPTPFPDSTANIDERGGIAWLAYPGHLTVARIPENSVAEKTNVTLTYQISPDFQGVYQGLDHFFKVSASRGGINIDSTPGSLPVELLLGYDSYGAIIYDTLSLYRMDAGIWVTGGLTMTERLGNSMGMLIDRPGIYGLLGETNRIYLPHVVRGD